MTKWSMEGLAVGVNKAEQIDVTITMDSEPTTHNIEQGKLSVERSLWHVFPMVFNADPERVEVHVNQPKPLDP